MGQLLNQRTDWPSFKDTKIELREDEKEIKNQLYGAHAFEEEMEM